MARRADRARRGRLSSHSPGRSSRRGLLSAGAAAAVAAIALFAYSRTATPPDAVAVGIPAPPAEARLPALRQHLQPAYEAAQQAASSADAVGDYCIALHADMFYAAAEQCYDATIERSAGGWQWFYYRALLQHDLGGGGDLTADLRTVVAQAPGFAPAWLRLGDAEFKAGRYAEADRAWTRAVQLPEPERLTTGPVPHLVEVPVASYASLGLARIRSMEGSIAEARRILEGVLAEGPPFSSAYRLLSEIETIEGRTAAAERSLARARRLPPYAAYADPMVDVLALESRNSTFLIRLASEANLAINAPWSEFLSRRALEFDPDNPEVVTKLARVLRTTGRNEEALVLFRRYQQMVPGDAQVLAHIGSCLSDLGRFSEAEPLLRKAVAALDDSISHYNLGLLLAMTGRLEEAVASYERALERDPADVNARINLASALVRRGQLDRAQRELERLLTIDPENTVALTNLGLVRAERGDVAGGRRALNEALQIDPAFQPAADALESIDRR